MTAIFALVRGDVLFVAGDTRRGSAYSLTVQKVHSWGDEVLLGQAGNGEQQSALIAQVKLGRCTPGQRGEPDFFGLYAKYRSAHVANVKPPAKSNGTILVAALKAATGLSALFEYDLPTGNRTPLAGNVAAIGTDPIALQAIADSHARRLGAGPSFALDEWAQSCIADAIALFPEEVGWPCDMAVSRTSPLGGRLIAERRIDQASATGVSEFRI